MGTPTQQKWITKLLGYSFLVEYKKSKENKVTDALSRRMEGFNASSDSLFVIDNQNAQLYLISFPCHTWLDVLKDSYKTDSEYLQLLIDLAAGPAPSILIFLFKMGCCFLRIKCFLVPIHL